MKISEQIFAIARTARVEDVKILSQEFMKKGHKQVAIDLYRCIIGNDRSMTKHVDHRMLVMLAERLEHAEELNAVYEARLMSDEALLAFAYGTGPLPQKLPPPPPAGY